jgi:GTPase
VTDDATPTIAVVGRQNVGKSTLVNRFFGRRQTIADDQPGVTRDRIELEVTWNGRRFGLVDTAGYVPAARGLEARTTAQAERALAAADVVLLVVDVHAGLTEDDAWLARRLRGASVPVLVVANKADSESDTADAARFHGLGLGEPFEVSALLGRGIGDLLDRVVDVLPEGHAEDLRGPSPEPRFVIVGRPNVGKSSLFNRLLGDERSVVSEEPGTTRDAVDSIVEWPGVGRVRFVDTAGMRRGTKVRGVEYYSFVRATRAIETADVALLVLDAAAGMTGEDKKIANRVIEAGRALVIVANKWDLVEDKDDAFKQLGEQSVPFAGAEVVRSSAVTGRGVRRLPPILMDLDRRWSTRVSTSTMNELLQGAQRERPTPRAAGNLHYVTQVGTGPPTFVIFGGARGPDPAYRRFLENRFRRELDLAGVPIRLRFRSRPSRPPRSTRR